MKLLFPRSILLMFSFLVLLGCSSDPGTDVSDLNKTNIKRLKNAYSIFQSAHGFKGPKNEKEFVDYCTTDAAAKVYLKRMGVDVSAFEDILVSERDGEKFAVRWGVNGQEDHPIVFEKTGVDGKRIVAFSTPREVSNEEYDNMLSGKYKPESSLGGMSVDDE